VTRVHVVEVVDPPEGTLRLALGLHTHWSRWRRASTDLHGDRRTDQNGQLDDSTQINIFAGR
jgi:hypothetical protein